MHAEPPGLLEGIGGTLGSLHGLCLHQDIVWVAALHDGVVMKGSVDTWERQELRTKWQHVTEGNREKILLA